MIEMLKLSLKSHTNSSAYIDDEGITTMFETKNTSQEQLNETSESQMFIFKKFKNVLSPVVNILKDLVLSNYPSEYDVYNIHDPFLQCKCIEFIRYMIILSGKVGVNLGQKLEYLNDCLAQVTITTDSNLNKNSCALAILYETVLTILSLEHCENGLRVLAINTLGKFLLNNDNNIRYVALNAIYKLLYTVSQNKKKSQKMLSKNIKKAIGKHGQVIVECLKDTDLSIRRRALDLIYVLVNHQNYQALSYELISYVMILINKDNQQMKYTSLPEKVQKSYHFTIDLIDKIWIVMEEFVDATGADKADEAGAAKIHWRLYNSIILLYMSSTACMLQYKEEILYEHAIQFILFCKSCLKSDAQQAYVIHQLYHCYHLLTKEGETMLNFNTKSALTRLAGLNQVLPVLKLIILYLLGEYAHHLLSPSSIELATTIQRQIASKNNANDDSDSDSAYLKFNQFTFHVVSESDILKLIEQELKHTAQHCLIKQYALNSLIKLKISALNKHHIEQLLTLYSSDEQLEIQQRSLEYRQLLHLEDELRNKIISPIPVLTLKKKKKKKKFISLESNGQMEESSSESSESEEEEDEESQEDESVEESDEASSEASSSEEEEEEEEEGQEEEDQKKSTTQTANLFDLNMFNNQQAATTTVQQETPKQNDDLLADIFGATSTKTTHPTYVVHQSSMLRIEFQCITDKNKVNEMEITAFFQSKEPLHSFEFQVSVPKYLKIQLHTASGTNVNRNLKITQKIKLIKHNDNKKFIMRARMKAINSSTNQPFMEQIQITKFPNQ